MENATRFVVVYKGLTPPVLFQIEKRLQPFPRCVVQIDPNNNRQLTAMPQEIRETIRKVSHPRSAHPRYSNVEGIPKGRHFVDLIYMTNQLSPESNG